MKTLLFLCALVAIMQASPLRQQLKPAVPLLEDNLGDIWTDCSSASDPAKIKSVVINPDPPQRGQSLSVNATVTLSEQVTGGSIKVDIKYGIFSITLIDKTLDLCDTVKSAGATCPLAAGDQNLAISESLPSVAPSGEYKGNAVVTDQSGNQLVCINLDFKL
ncbi:PREDICTED: putative phosphatidylglycerol/phosphatidylinositol transfer protein DDB_G0278295 isoform X3 [Amphimedon queenslandica]|uniref:MD-2-related lipid-recognition domain-containing protein n=1 Tax=Amphimedon queenslandica TaxID=400682 RepID=A0A1X7ULT0_AMPQE|nr:PREDICTED: putative phosphatidylglycerol/phosphatidylinositol transfer protein DDB_G0278295 isoform X3 [Amphimedon queenslandica]|eukprot:XP_003387353.2 PREDICTED: putative phosphatidylglycerol/phosphatidylinositol transfer protein DDB_G0278295 isoform X3 [Amphimedon queenslandica]